MEKGEGNEEMEVGWEMAGERERRNETLMLLTDKYSK